LALRLRFAVIVTGLWIVEFWWGALVAGGNGCGWSEVRGQGHTFGF